MVPKGFVGIFLATFALQNTFSFQIPIDETFVYQNSSDNVCAAGFANWSNENNRTECFAEYVCAFNNGTWCSGHGVWYVKNMFCFFVSIKYFM